MCSPPSSQLHYILYSYRGFVPFFVLSDLGVLSVCVLDLACALCFTFLLNPVDLPVWVRLIAGFDLYTLLASLCD